MFILKYEGLDADRHLLDALTGGESLAGFGHALTLVAHYAATEKVKFRAPYSRDVRFYFQKSREGSLEWMLHAASPDNIALGLGAGGLINLVSYVFARSIGQDSDLLDDVDGIEQRAGDLEALVEAVEPSLRKAHRAIGTTAKTITLFDNSSKKTSVFFDATSKEYLNDDIDAGTSTQDVSIPAMNINSRYGRAYFSDLSRTVPFKVSLDATPRTITELSRALDDYANKNGVTVNIRFLRIKSSDERLKRIVIYDAKHLDSDDL